MQAWRIYCGRGRRDGRSVSPADIKAFIDASVRPRFSSFTLHRADGFWQFGHEASVIIEIVTSRQRADKAVHRIAADYKRTFDQDAVLVVRSRVQSALV
jgi:hypothetical protein